MPRLVILAPILTAYRVPIYEQIGLSFELTVLCAQPEDNRPGWGAQLVPKNASFAVKRSWGFVLKIARRVAGRVFEYRYIQVTPGHLVDLAAIRPDAIVSTEMGIRSLLALAYGGLCGIPVWLWVGETRHTALGAGALRQWMRRRLFAPYCNHYIAFGASTTQYLLEELGVARARVVQIQNSIDPAMFINTENILPARTFALHPVLLHVGQILARKGVLQLIEAAATLQAEGARFTLVFVGAGEGLEEARRLSRSLTLTCIEFIDPVPPGQIASWYAACDVVVFPTLEDVWGLVANEAIQMGKPLLCSKYAGCVDELVPNSNQFDPLDATDFARALRRAVAGEVPAIDPAVLRPAKSSAGSLVRAIQASIVGPE